MLSDFSSLVAAPAMGVLSDIDGPAPCYPAFPQLALVHQWHRDGVNHARAHQLGSRLLAGPLQPGTMFQGTPGRASPHPPGGRPTARASVNGYPYRMKVASASPKKSSNSAPPGTPRAVLGDQLAPGPGQPPAESGRATTAPPLVTTPETRRWPGRPSRSQPTASLSRESACQAVGHWLHHSLLQLRTTGPSRLSLSLVRRTRRPRCPLCRRGAGGHVTVAATPERRVDGEPLVGSGGQFACWSSGRSPPGAGGL
jgi:hypothetical protein